ncbi:hypothetical protein [Bradyrhizobium sp. ARR65]|uniref:hypothetical protein n=1 Tax=Bradyrhizobium sp. ARR65 TaxID=1040989 RepID=UPI000462ED10|nr:hypothetical protein [Bradyrhizobium sp. ARR65]
MSEIYDTLARDTRIARHEAAHLTVGRALGAEFGGATIEENLDLGFSGLVWGPDFQSCFSGKTSSTIQQIDDLMPRDGDTRDEDTAPIFQHVHNRIIELTAGSEAEKLAFGAAWAATDDRKQEKQLARLIFTNAEAADAFIAACALEARAILQRQADVLDALTNALLQHRTIDGAQIDDTIAKAVAARQIAEEHQRRKRWQDVVANASRFEAEQQRDA